MHEYDIASHASARAIMQAYSTSFGIASRTLPKTMRQAIYDIYGLVRIADEIVDTYKGQDTADLLDSLEQDTYDALKRGYSTNLIVHAFQLTASKYDIDASLIKPFFASMRTDITPSSYQVAGYEQYIHGSAEVIGLMCLKVFIDGNTTAYEQLAPGAAALGAAFQKVNFLRDIKADHEELGRYYFPIGTYDSFNDATKQAIITDIDNDLAVARKAMVQLPRQPRRAVTVAATYYQALLDDMRRFPASRLKTVRPRVSNRRKLLLLGKTYISN